MNIVVLGSGGREHAIAWALAKSPRCESLYVAPGNGGTAACAENVSYLDINDAQAIVDFCRDHAIDLVVIGPEAPLVAGVADMVREAGIAVFGPGAAGAELEGSKSFAKRFMAAAGIPTADYQVFHELEPALVHLKEVGAPIVIKADGLAAGKGVVVADTVEAAESAIRACFVGAFGDAGSTVVLEEKMEGPECSLLAFVTDGQAFCMAPAQDHKRAFDGDRGPNTGGMGVYSPVPIVTDEEMAAMESIMATAAAACETGPEGPMDYRGVLYGGFMLTPAGPKIVEFNVRFGDPETQVVLPLLESDLFTIMRAVREQTLAQCEVRFSTGCACCVIMASDGYPVKYEKGYPITIPDGIVPHVYVAGGALKDGRLVTSGGRVLGVTATAPTLQEAIEGAYARVQNIHFDNAFYRRDIGKRAMDAAK